MKTRPDRLRTIGIIANPEKAGCRQPLQRAIRQIERSGRHVLLDAATASLGRRKGDLPTPRAVSVAADCLLVFGGDGTILRVARETAGTGTPLLGINVGNLGFLTAASTPQLPEVLRTLWAGHYDLESRPLIEAQVRQGGGVTRQLALNDFVIARGGATRLIELEVLVDDAPLTRYRCDGLIVSSPTGSTAYSLAAGGAIVAPNAEVFALTPICPHTLSNRPLILNLRSIIQVRVLSSRVAVELSADGQVQTELHPGDHITIRRSQRAVPLVRLRGRSFFTTLRHKLRWSGSPV